MATSFSPARLFSRTGRLGSRHQKKRSCESTDSQLPGDRRPSTASEWTATDDFRHSPNGHVTAPSPHRHYRPRGDDTAGTMKASLGLSPAFQGLPPSLQLDSHSFMEDDELRALGITTREEGNTGKSKGWRQRSARARCGADKNLDDVFEMEVPIQVARDKRPDLQVSIPQVKTARSKSPRLVTTAIAAPTPQSAISTSSLKSSRPPKSGTTGTPLSIVSPLSVVEMPKPQRPFSAESIEGLASQGRTDGAGGAPQSASTESAAPGQRKFADRGRRPSTASVGSETDILLQQAGGLAPPTVVDATALRVDTATLYHAALVSTPASRVKKEQKRSKTSPTPNVHYMRRQTSSTSLTTNNTMNINKPLPPEPGRPGTSPLKHIAYSTSITHKTPDPATPSRSNSTTTQKKKLTRGETASPDSPQAISMSRKNSRASLSKVSLRSKFTPKDLDAMDDAFQRRPSINNQHFHSSPYSNHSSPSHSQISLTIDTKHLQTITENSPRSSDVRSLRNEPVQISRGPMRMEPTRRPPQPPKAPQRVHTIAVEKVGRRKPSMTRSASNTKLKTQENGEEPPARRSSTNVAMSKAEKILGRMGPPPSSRPEVRPSFDFSWGASDSPRDYIMTESPAAASEEENDMPELEARHNAQEMEIRRRLALLSAKDDPSTVFEALHKDNSDTPLQRSIDKNKELSEKKPTIEDKLHLTGSLRNEINVPTHIAELEAANRTPSPAELEGSNMPAPAEEPAELGLSSPAIIPTIPIPPEPDETSQRRGRFTTSDPHSTASGKSSHSQRSIRVRSLASLAASDIPDMYASLPTPNQSVRPSMSGEEVDDLITADAAERVLLHILQSLDNLEDLFAASMVSKGFYRTFKRHELYLLKRAIWRMSPSAWELREMSIPYSELPPGAVDYTPHLYFRHYVQDLLTMVEIKAMILESCKSFLRLETISGLAGETERSPMIDEAFWRVWTFCRIFGCGNSREDDIVGQMDWLKGGVLARQSPDTRTLALTDELARNSVLFNPPAGFAKGNGKGLSSEELYDMYEIWTCLGVLVRGYQGKRQEARDYGVFDRCDVPRGDEVRENAILGRTFGTSPWAMITDVRQRSGRTTFSLSLPRLSLMLRRLLHQRTHNLPRLGLKGIQLGTHPSKGHPGRHSSKKQYRASTKSNWL